MPLILGTNSIKDTGYNVANSLRFNSGSSDSLTRTPSSAGNRKTFTISVWFKISKITDDDGLIFAHSSSGSNDEDGLGYRSDGEIFFMANNGSDAKLVSNAKHRDFSAWYHWVVAVDTTQGTASNRVKIYKNGTQVTSFSTENYPSQDYQFKLNNNVHHSIGENDDGGGTGNFFSGYMAEVVMIDGQALTPTSFGEFDEDSPTIWKPKDVSGLTFGTNGFYLDFEDSSNLGNDANGGTDWTESNLAATDQSTDTCTNNFATWNPLASSSQVTLSEGNLKAVGNSSDDGNVFCNMVPKSGKWYAEFKITKSNDGIPTVGIRQESSGFRLLNGTSGAVGYYQYEASVRPDGQRYTNNSTASWGGSTFITGSIVGIALDCDNGAGYISVNGTYMNSGDPTSGGSKTGAFITWTEAQAQYGGQTFASRIYTTSSAIEANFGSPPYSESGGNSDGNGYGNFKTAPPSNYYSLNTKNLAEFG